MSMPKEKDTFWEYPRFQRLALLTLQALGIGEFTPTYEFPIYFTWRIYVPFAFSLISFLTGLFIFSDGLWPFQESETLFTYLSLDFLSRLCLLGLFWIPIAFLLFIFFLSLIGREYYFNAYGIIGYYDDGIRPPLYTTTRKEWFIYLLGVYVCGFVLASFFFPQSIEIFIWPLLWLNYIGLIPNLPLLIFGYILLGSFYIPLIIIFFIIPTWLVKELVRLYFNPENKRQGVHKEDSYILNMKRISITIDVIVNLVSLILVIGGLGGLELFGLPNLIVIFMGLTGFVISSILAKFTTK